MSGAIWDAVAADHAALDGELDALLDAAIPGRRRMAAWRALTRTARPGPAVHALIPQRRPLPAGAVAIPFDRKAVR